MGVTFVGVAANFGGDVSSITGYIPGGGTTVGDLLIALTTISRTGGSNMILPSGWTDLHNGVSSKDGITCISQLSYRVVEAGDTSWVWSSSYTNTVYGISVFSYTGQSTTNFINAIGKWEGYGSTVTAPSIPYTLTNHNSLIIQTVSMAGGNFSSPPATLTINYNIGGTACYTSGYRNVSGGGHTGAATWNASPENPAVALTAVINAESSFVPAAVII